MPEFYECGERVPRVRNRCASPHLPSQEKEKGMAKKVLSFI